MIRLILLGLIIYGAYSLYQKFKGKVSYKPKDPQNCTGKCVGCPHINECLSKNRPEFRSPINNHDNNKDDNQRF